MRILYIASSGGAGGASVALLNLISRLLTDKYEIHVVFPSEGSFSEQVEMLGIKCHYVGFYRLTTYPRTESLKSRIKYPYTLINTLFNNYFAYKNLLKLCLDLMPDLIHTNVGPLDIGFKVAKKLNIKHVWHLREYQDLDFNLKFFPSKSQFINYINAPSNYCIAITKGVFEYWRLKGENHRMIYDGVIDDDYKKKPINVNSNKQKIFLFVGRVEKAKGVDILLNAFAKFCKENDEFNLLIAGKGHGRFLDECLHFVEHHKIDNRVSFLGHRTDIYSLMSEATALIVPSRFEGFGFITVEAMYNKCLVIGKNTAGTKEQFDLGLEQTANEIALRFSSEDELLEEMKVAIGLSANEYDLITKRAFEVISKNYKIEDHVKSVESFYNLIIKK